MERGGMVALGMGLLVLWLVGLSDLATRWLSWLNGAAGVAALVAAGSALGPERVTGSAAGSSVAIAIGLFVLWVIGLAAGATGWLTWWTFAFALGFLGLGLYLGAESRRRPGFPRTMARTTP